MGLNEFRERLDRILADLERRVAGRSTAGGLYDALVETRAAASAIRDAIRSTESELAAERTRLTDTERRGRLAREIGDLETADLAEFWAGKHRERVELLERKLQVQRDELDYAERQAAELKEALCRARQGGTPGAEPVIGADGGLEEENRQLDQRAREALVREQLAALKKRLGREP
jgi:hypothetical protein